MKHTNDVIVLEYIIPGKKENRICAKKQKRIGRLSSIKICIIRFAIIASDGDKHIAKTILSPHGFHAAISFTGFMCLASSHTIIMLAAFLWMCTALYILFEKTKIRINKR